MEAKKERTGGDSWKRWIDLIPSITKRFNSKKIERTSFKRGEVNIDNYYKFLAEKYDVKDHSFILNKLHEISVDGPGWKKLRDDHFKFKLDQLVLVDKFALTGDAKRTLFSKPSVYGSFHPKPFKIIKLALKASTNEFMVPGAFASFPITIPDFKPLSLYSYYLCDDTNKDVPGFFYAEELRAVAKRRS